MEVLRLLASFMLFSLVLLSCIGVVHVGRLALMDYRAAARERWRRRANSRIIPLDPNAIPHTIERWHYGSGTRRNHR